MSEALDLTSACPSATDGDIAIINLDSSRRRSWSRFWQAPERTGIAETIIEQEQLTAQFVGDLEALDRLQLLATTLSQLDESSGRTALINAQIASALHCFSHARRHLADAVKRGAPQDATYRLALSIDQACGMQLNEVLKARQCAAERSGKLEDLVPLGALLADLCEFAAADETYRRALRAYTDVSPFAVALVYFQLGVLWGENVTEPQPDVAARWYRKAIDYVPSYAKARVHLSEIYCSCDRLSEAEGLLLPAVACGDPEVSWRLADVMALQGKTADAESHMRAAQSGFAMLLDRHLLAFADHGAEFFAGSGGDHHRAIELLRIDVENRPTLRAFERAYRIAIDVDNVSAASELLAAATRRWGGFGFFHRSSLARTSPSLGTSQEQTSDERP